MLGAVCKNGEVPVDLLHKHGIQLLPNGVITPSDYFISDKGEAIPYEFHGLGGLLWLSVQDPTIPVSAHEMSDPDTRLNMLYYREPTDEEWPGLLTTTWRAKNVNGVIQAKKCSYCNDLEYHHKNCTDPTH
ncbi:hypothetical protein B0T24DRAFT_598466 [Lasiosphaeria ovina]|uniref:Uncharacterized protein n=1 Tax=Lasiosphaeria ovina TaxID=92902 RepID=A0AAE0JW50_9PEZI|nr:hypothetical protein B0T24DRAFT_598466 [Lasiosphaeria ovina]